MSDAYIGNVIGFLEENLSCLYAMTLRRVAMEIVGDQVFGTHER